MLRRKYAEEGNAGKEKAAGCFVPAAVDVCMLEVTRSERDRIEVREQFSEFLREFDKGGIRIQRTGELEGERDYIFSKRDLPGA